MERAVLFEAAIHHLDLMRYFFGEARTVYAHIRHISPHMCGEDLATVIAEFGPTLAIVERSWCSHGPAGEEMRIEGREGTLVWGNGHILRLYSGQSGRCEVEEPVENGPEGVVDAFARLQAHFVECVRTGMTPLTYGEDNLRTLELVFAAYRSAEEQRVIQIPPRE
jgi:predicted dehydrogenase